LPVTRTYWTKRLLLYLDPSPSTENACGRSPSALQNLHHREVRRESRAPPELANQRAPRRLFLLPRLQRWLIATSASPYLQDDPRYGQSLLAPLFSFRLPLYIAAQWPKAGARKLLKNLALSHKPLHRAVTKWRRAQASLSQAHLRLCRQAFIVVTLPFCIARSTTILISGSLALAAWLVSAGTDGEGPLACYGQQENLIPGIKLGSLASRPA
jgi:hypothetical protein